MNETIGNQQITSHQIAWISGIWDGEGSFCIYPINRKNDKKITYHGQVTITNTSEIMINEIVKILDFYKIGAHLFLENPRTNKHKACWHITVGKRECQLRLVKLMLPYLIAKKAHAEILIRFLLSREKYRPMINRNGKGQIMGVVRQGNTQEEISLYDQLKALNKTGSKEEISQTTRRTL